MTRTTLFYNEFNLTFPPGGVGEDGGWTPTGGNDWDDFNNVILAPGAYSPPVSLTIDNTIPNNDSVVIWTQDFDTAAGINMDIEFVFSIHRGVEITTGTMYNQKLIIRLRSGFLDITAELQYCFDYFCSAPIQGPSLYLWNTGFTGPDLWSKSENIAQIALPEAGGTTWNAMRIRYTKFAAVEVWVNTGMSGFWNEVPMVFNAIVQSFPTFEDIHVYLRQDAFTNLAEFSIDNLGIYTDVDDTVTDTNISIGMVDENGLVLIGIDPDDDGSGDSSLGGDGLGGGGLGGMIDGVGLIGAGSDGNVASSDTPPAAGEYSPTSWRGPGSGISITGWNFTKVLDSFGYAEIDLHLDNSFNYALGDAYKGKNLSIATSEGVLYRGYCKEVDIIDDYKGRLILEDTHAVLQRRETQKNYATNITLFGIFGSPYAKVTAVTSTTITFAYGFIPESVATDSTFAVLVVPGENESLSTETFDLLVDGTGDILDVNVDNHATVSKNIINEGTDWLIIQGTYSGVKGDLEALDFHFRFSIAEIILSQSTVRFDIFDYDDAADWDTEFLDSYIYHGTLGIGMSGKIEVQGSIKTDVQKYINTADNKFKLRFRIGHGSADNAGIALNYARVRAYSNPLYDKSHFPITGKSNLFGLLSRFTVTGNPLTSGVAIGDVIVVGKRNDLVLQELGSEFFNRTGVTVDANFTNYTATNFLANNMKAYDAIRSVLKKDNGMMMFDSASNMLIFKKRENLIATGVTLSDRAGDDVVVKFLEQQGKTAEEVIQVQVTGSAYKTLDDEKPVYAEGDLIGPENALIKRISEPSYTSVTEAQNRVDSEIALLGDAREPVHTVEIPLYAVDLTTLNIGRTFDIRRRTTEATSTENPIPLRMIQVNYEGYNQTQIILDLGWKGTSFRDRAIESENEKRRILRSTYRSMKTRAQGKVTGNEITSHLHTGYTDRQNTEEIVATGAGTGVSTTATVDTKYGLYIIGNDNGGGFTSATVELQVSFDGGSNYIKALEFDIDTEGSGFSDFTMIPQYHTGNVWTYLIGSKLQTDTIHIRYNVTELTVAGDSDLTIILLQSL